MYTRILDPLPPDGSAPAKIVLPLPTSTTPQNHPLLPVLSTDWKRSHPLRGAMAWQSDILLARQTFNSRYYSGDCRHVTNQSICKAYARSQRIALDNGSIID